MALTSYRIFLRIIFQVIISDRVIFKMDVRLVMILKNGFNFSYNSKKIYHLSDKKIKNFFYVTIKHILKEMVLK